MWTFSPDAILKKICMLMGLGAVRSLVWWLGLCLRSLRRDLLLRSPMFPVAQRAAQIRLRRLSCKSYREFARLGEELDRLEGREAWKTEDSSPHYNADSIRGRLSRYFDMRAAGDVEGTMFALRGEMHRKHFGVSNSALFEVCTSGTKRILEDYVESVCDSLRWVAFEHRGPIGVCLTRDARATSRDQILHGPKLDPLSDSRSELSKTQGQAEKAEKAANEEFLFISLKDKLAFFQETRHAFGHTALLLSGGGGLGVYHFGVIKALHLQGLLPRVISGTSAGSIICGLIGTRNDAELQKLWQEGTCWSKEFDFNFFGSASLSRFLEEGYQNLYNAEHLGKALRRNLDNWTFLEAFDRTGRIINITVSSTPGSTRYPMLLNYLTAPHVLIWSASLASCALPGVFMPSELLAKDRQGRVVPYLSEGLKWRDGSMENDLPMTRLAELFNVNNFIVSQVNPHARLLTGGGGYTFRSSDWRVPGSSVVQFLKHELKSYLRSTAAMCMGTVGRHVSPWLRPVGWSLVGFLTQEYEGDITIYNGQGLLSLSMLLKNPTEDVLVKFFAEAERETWRFLPQIAALCNIEFTMDEIIRELRAELQAQGPPGIPGTPDGVMQRRLSFRMPSSSCLQPMGGFLRQSSENLRSALQDAEDGNARPTSGRQVSGTSTFRRLASSHSLQEFV